MVDMVTQLCESTKTTELYILMMNFMVYEVYLKMH